MPIPFLPILVGAGIATAGFMVGKGSSNNSGGSGGAGYSGGASSDYSAALLQQLLAATANQRNSEAQLLQLKQEYASQLAKSEQRNAELQKKFAAQQQKSQTALNEMRRDMQAQMSQIQQALDLANADKEQMRRVNDELYAFGRSAAQRVEEVEGEILQMGESYIKALGESLGLNAERQEAFVAKCLRDLHRSRGQAAQQVRARISLGDEECRRLLELAPSPQKQQQMNDFVSQIATNSFNAIKGELLQSLNESVASACAAYRQEIAAKKSNLESQVRQLEVISDAKDAPGRERELAAIAARLAWYEATLAAINDKG